jgi:hypothetical protein
MEVQPVIDGKRRGRPPGSKIKNSSVTAVKKDAKFLIPTLTYTPSPARFTVYKCGWRACNAQLHNIATLRQHIAKKHKPLMSVAVKNGYICLWRESDCFQLDDDDRILPIKSFDSHSDWLSHIEDAHLHPLGKKYGDGPSTIHIGKPMIDFNTSKYLYRPLMSPVARTFSHTDPQSIAKAKTRYLSDEHGRTTTATASIVVTEEHPADVLTLTSVTADDFMHVKGYEEAQGRTRNVDRRGKIIDVKKASEDILKAMEVRKEKTGPGIDRGGCTLVNDARRSTLVQNANIARIVEVDY